LTEACLEESVAHLAAAILANVKAITEDSVARMDSDAQDISRFYGRFQKPERVRWLVSWEACQLD